MQMRGWEEQQCVLRKILSGVQLPITHFEGRVVIIFLLLFLLLLLSPSSSSSSSSKMMSKSTTTTSSSSSMSATSVCDCNCYVTENYFVDKILNRKLRLHLYYDGNNKDFVKEQLEQIYGLVDDTKLSNEEYQCLFEILNKEQNRRQQIEIDHIRRKTKILELYDSNKDFKGGKIMSDESSSSSSSLFLTPLKLNINLETTTFTDDDNEEENCWLTKECIAALRRISSSSLSSSSSPPSKSEILALSGGIELVKNRIYALPILTPRACKLLDDNFKTYGEKFKNIKGRPNTMNRFGVLLDEMPNNNVSHDLSDVLLEEIIRPLAMCLLGTKEQEQQQNEENVMIQQMCQTLDHHHVFTVDYRANEQGYDKDLSLHHDNSEITMNILLTEDFEGGELAFEGPSPISPPSHHHQDGRRHRLKMNPLCYEHQLGWGVLHMGCEMHRALPVDDGRRSNLIVWCRSSSHRLQHGCPMCGGTDRLKEDVLRRYQHPPREQRNEGRRSK